MSRKPAGTSMGRYFALAQTGVEMVVPIFIGSWLDRHLGWKPWGVIGGVVLGFAGGLFHLLILMRKLEEAEQEENRPPRDEQ